ncbi:hypothetical protein Pla123a_46340 [Posidoniimonas polymericola]|uniref:Uncharacterized protein n=1 Tax=Posidoniimonas polymericola TaxID=2528002 RepID=A0A5C5XTW9_9BACT|nr:hypothetical protein [Posidoniimonas polymericola]TWT66746.1 hypothetical protein Pla123a_46340 [Posidoniimonas polymericola]
MNPPPWLRRVCLISLLVGLALVVLGPVLAYGVVSWQVDQQAGDPAKAFEAAIEPWRQGLLWTTPIGMAMVFQGGLGLLFFWVTRVADASRDT